jgi:hypothetical protein
MKRRTWDAQTQAMMVVEGSKEKPSAELSPEHKLNQSRYDQWRDQFLAQAAKAFDEPQRPRKEARLAQEHMATQAARRGAPLRAKQKR